LVAAVLAETSDLVALYKALGGGWQDNPAAAPNAPAAPVAVRQQTMPPSAARAAAPMQRVTIRFDNRMAALTPGGIHALDEAVVTIRAGQTVEIAIEGCDASADHADGSACARRAMSLRQLLVQRGVRPSGYLLGAEAQ
jgi:outer membrane protein OmpA-like peptidoglycan-associated protein